VHGIVKWKFIKEIEINELMKLKFQGGKDSFFL
jgi:hypothetical protein